MQAPSQAEIHACKLARRSNVGQSAKISTRTHPGASPRQAGCCWLSFTETHGCLLTQRLQQLLSIDTAPVKYYSARTVSMLCDMPRMPHIAYRVKLRAAHQTVRESASGRKLCRSHLEREVRGSSGGLALKQGRQGRRIAPPRPAQAPRVMCTGSLPALASGPRAQAETMMCNSQSQHGHVHEFCTPALLNKSRPGSKSAEPGQTCCPAQLWTPPWPALPLRWAGAAVWQGCETPSA